VLEHPFFFTTTLMTVVSYLIFWLYELSLLRFAMCFCCNFLIIIWLSSISSGIKLARFVWELTFYVIEIWGHSLWLTTNFLIILSPPKSLRATLFPCISSIIYVTDKSVVWMLLYCFHVHYVCRVKLLYVFF